MTRRQIERLDRIRRKKRLTYKAVGDAAGCHPSYVAGILLGYKEVPKYKMVTMERIVEAIESA